MSTSPDAQKGGNLAIPQAKAGGNPALTLLKGILWITLAVAAVTVLAMNYDVVWDILAEFVPVVLEVIEETLDTFFEKVVRLNPMLAQMATAYTGFVLFLVALYLVIRKGIKVYQKAQTKKAEISQDYAQAWEQWYGGVKAAGLNWWDSLDFVSKIIAGVAFVLLGIPIALLLSFVLGSLVAELL